MGSPAGLMSSRDVLGGELVMECLVNLQGLLGGGGCEGVFGVTCKGAAARGIEEGGIEQAKGSVLMDGGGTACCL